MVNDKYKRPPVTEKVQAQGPNRLVGTSEEVPSKSERCLMQYLEFSPHTGPRPKPRGLLEDYLGENLITLHAQRQRKVPAFCFAPQPKAMRKTKEESRLTRKVSLDTYRATNLYWSSVCIRRPHGRRLQTGVRIAPPQWGPHHTYSLPPAASWIIQNPMRQKLLRDERALLRRSTPARHIPCP